MMLDICVAFMKPMPASDSNLSEIDQFKAMIEATAKVPHEVHIDEELLRSRSISISRNDMILGGAREFVAVVTPDVDLPQGWGALLIEELKSQKDAGSVYAVNVSRVSGMPAASRARSVAVFRRGHWKEIKGYDERFRFYGVDEDFERRMAIKYAVESKPSSKVAVRSVRNGYMAKATLLGEIAHQKEADYKTNLVNALNDGTLKFWNDLPDEEREKIRKDRKYKFGGEA